MHSPLLNISTATRATAADLQRPLCSVLPSLASPDILRAMLPRLPAEGPPTVVAVDLDAALAQLHCFQKHLPHVAPHYAIKCLPDPVIMAHLAQHGANFDAASPAELSLATTALRSVGDLPSISTRVVYANPVKAPGHLRLAAAAGVDLLTFDSSCELAKLADHHPKARALLRIATDDATSAIPLSTKFGAHPPELPGLFATARKLGVTVAGIAFHVGSGATSVASYATALRTARAAFSLAEQFGHRCTVLDVGGGFPGVDGDITFAEIAKVINEHIPLFPPGTRAIAEPGRFLVASAVMIASRVLRVSNIATGTAHYSIGDGVYGVFRDARMCGEVFLPQPLMVRGGRPDPLDSLEECNLYGPTDERCDVVGKGFRLPRMQPGDWMWFPHAGSYTLSMRSRRSDLEAPTIVYVFREGKAGVEQDCLSLGTSRSKCTPTGSTD